jgi:hypothetical protein
MMDNKLWIFGDSFANCGDTTKGEIHWPQIICSKFKGENYHVSSKVSRDFQTILDIFLRNLKDISNNDFVILIVPSLGRVRVPLQIPVMDVEHSNIKHNYNWRSNHIDYFMGESSYRNETKYNILENPLTNIDEHILRKKLEISSIINDSDASKNNYLKIIESLKSYLPFEIFIWSWDNQIESELVLNRNEITEIIGYWHTLRDLYKETNGEEGKMGDVHFSPKMHKAFADYLIIKFPQYFDYESKIL